MAQADGSGIIDLLNHCMTFMEKEETPAALIGIDVLNISESEDIVIRRNANVIRVFNLHAGHLVIHHHTAGLLVELKA